MTWQLGSVVILGFGLLLGFAWYERARPDARIVALVATLAAFAIVGRIAFAAFPNVKPTTDIVLVSGYALGGGPGFAVGAVTGLVSNFFFGQGPWTPWQMAAWGMTGVIGAGLALATRDRIGRWPLAVVCTVVGFLFTVVQDVGDWVTYSDHSSAQLLTYIGTGIGFDVIDAAGCLAFALLFGPALLRSVQRFARRLHVSFSPPAALAPALLLSVVCLSAFGAVRSARAAQTPASYLLSAQNSDGGFGGASGQSSSALYSGWAALGLASEGINPATVSRGGRSLLAYIEAGAGASLSDPGSLERTILVARAAGVPVTSFGGHDLLAALEHDIRPDGSVAQQVNLTTFAVLALRAAGVAPAVKTIGWLVRQEDSDGGFSFATAGAQSDVDDTGAALEALAGTGAPTAAVRRRAVSFIRRQQNNDGGFPSSPYGLSNAQSTAWAVQGLIADGISAGSVHVRGSASPVAYLESLIRPGGAIDYARGTEQTPVWVTGEALMALAGKPLPLAPLASPSVAPIPSGSSRPLGSGPSASPAARPSGPPAARSSVHRRPGVRSRRPALAVFRLGVTVVLALAGAGVG